MYIFVDYEILYYSQMAQGEGRFVGVTRVREDVTMRFLEGGLMVGFSSKDCGFVRVGQAASSVHKQMNISN